MGPWKLPCRRKLSLSGMMENLLSWTASLGMDREDISLVSSVVRA